MLYSGTIIFTDKSSMILDPFKAIFIKDFFNGAQIVLFYCFKAELDLLIQVFGSDLLTTDLKEFNETDKSIALQVVSGREGINLSKAAAIAYFNISFSAVSYWQSRDRLTTFDKKSVDVYFFFAKNSIDYYVYNAVSRKKKFTSNLYKNKKNDTSKIR